MFERPHHLRIAQVLYALDGQLLKQHDCLFGGGTAIALRYGEYRESVDIDFLVSNAEGYRKLRHLLTGPRGLATIARAGAQPLTPVREVRADQYGIRTTLTVAQAPVKFEIVLEARIELDTPVAGDEICGIATLTPLDMATSKLLANSDRWSDDAVFSRDVIDLAMMKPSLALLRAAIVKAKHAYGESVLRDLARAIDKLESREGWLERCMQSMAMNHPKAQVWQRIRALRKVLR